MKIGVAQYDITEERARLMRGDDGRAAANVQVAQVGADSQDKAEESKKSVMAQAGDTVQISEEAREMQRTAATEKADEETRQDTFSQEGGQEGGQEDDAAATAGQNSGGLTMSGANATENSEEDDSGGRVEQLRKQLKEAQKKLQQAQEKLQQAMLKAQSAEDQVEKDIAQSEVSMAQLEVGTLTSEIQKLNEELSKALQQEAGGSGGSGKIAAVAGGGWAPSGKRLSVGRDGITSLS